MRTVSSTFAHSVFGSILFALIYTAQLQAQDPAVSNESTPRVLVEPKSEDDAAAESLGSPAQDAGMLNSPRFEAQRSFAPGYDFISQKGFENAILFPGTNAYFKIGGYVKFDAIHDFNPIDSPDFFNPIAIPIGAPQRHDSHFHARQSRLNIDTRWLSDNGPARVFVEGDFFADGNAFRLRHAYGEMNNFLVGQTWTTFTDHNALPQTIDNQGGVAGISTRRSQFRYTRELPWDGWHASMALEESTVTIDSPETLPGESRTPTPDFVARIRVSQDWGQLQLAGVARQIGFQPPGSSVETAWAGGVNFTGWLNILDSDKVLFQVVAGDGIGSFRDLPDAAPDTLTTLAPLHTFAWMTGYAHSWSDRWTSNLTFNESFVSNTSLQSPDSVHRTTYVSANLIWNPTNRLWVGVEYLYGTRSNLNGDTSDANRLQFAMLFEIP
jgi:Porin subfamily